MDGFESCFLEGNEIQPDVASEGKDNKHEEDTDEGEYRTVCLPPWEEYFLRRAHIA